MKKVVILSFVCILSGLLLIACQRDEGVRAGNDQGTDTYQPRPAPQTQMPRTQTDQDIRGELIRVDTKNKTVTVRLANGVEQTFKVDDTTMVMGLEQKQTTTRNLMGKEGSEVTVQWVDDGGAKKAAHINVVEVKTARPKKR